MIRRQLLDKPSIRRSIVAAWIWFECEETCFLFYRNIIMRIDYKTILETIFMVGTENAMTIKNIDAVAQTHCWTDNDTAISQLKLETCSAAYNFRLKREREKVSENRKIIQIYLKTLHSNQMAVKSFMLLYRIYAYHSNDRAVAQPAISHHSTPYLSQ